MELDPATQQGRVLLDRIIREVGALIRSLTEVCDEHPEDGYTVMLVATAVLMRIADPDIERSIERFRATWESLAVEALAEGYAYRDLTVKS